MVHEGYKHSYGAKEEVEKFEGYLTLVIVEAKLSGRHTDIITEMDLFVNFKVGNFGSDTVTLRNDGMKPYWDFEWELLVKDINMDLEIYVKDEDWFWDDTVGSTRLKVSNLINGGRINGFKNWYPIYFEGKETGQIHLKGVWEPKVKPEPKQKEETVATETTENNSEDKPVDDFAPKITADSFLNYAQNTLT